MEMSLVYMLGYIVILCIIAYLFVKVSEGKVPAFVGNVVWGIVAIACVIIIMRYAGALLPPP